MQRTAPSGNASPNRVGIGVYAATLMATWAFTALLTVLGIGLWWDHHRWKLALLAIGGVGMTVWLGVGVGELLREGVAWVFSGGRRIRGHDDAAPSDD